MIKFLDLGRQYREIQSEVDEAIRSVLETSHFIGGPAVASFEAEFADYQAASHCVGVGNGTDALEIALEALGLPPGSEILVPANSFIASSEAVTRTGHRVVFVDIDRETYSIDVAAARRAVTPKTAAIVAVHLHGHPAPMDELLILAEEFGLKIVEDAAQAHGAEWDGRRVGAIGDIGTFSFYPGKNLGAYGDGGAILTNSDDLARRCRMIANHGRQAKYDHEFEGRNSRLDAMQAAILSVKLRHLDRWIENRRMIAATYSAELAGIDGLALPVTNSRARHAFHLYVVRCADREALVAHLKENGIQTGVHYPISLPKLGAYQYLGEPDPNWLANQWDSELLSLPIGDHLTKSDATFVAAKVREFFDGS